MSCRKSATCSRSNSRPRPRPQAARAKIDAGHELRGSWPPHAGLKPDQISLGTLAEADLPDADRAKAIFALPLNEVSQPIKTGFGGFALVRVTKITPGSTKTLADVKEDIRKTLATQLAANKLVDVVNAFTDAAVRRRRSERGGQEGRHEVRPCRRGGRHRPEARRQQGRGAGRSGIPARRCSRPKWARTPIPSPPRAGAYYVVHVNGVTPPKLKPLDQVRAAGTGRLDQRAARPAAGQPRPKRWPPRPPRTSRWTASPRS